MNKTVSLDEERGALVIIDQTLLPHREELIFLTELEDIRDAIYSLKVRGAPAIGVTAAIGIYLEAVKIANRIIADSVRVGDTAGAGEGAAVGATDATASTGVTGAGSAGAGASVHDLFMSGFRAAKNRLNSARPTAVNLSWALNRMERAALECVTREQAGDAQLQMGGARERARDWLAAVVACLKTECRLIMDEDTRVCAELGIRGLELLKPGMGLLTHCNAGRLATASEYGTATAPIYLGHERGYGFKVYCDETRPLLQGARLTAYELCAAGVDATLLCDNMAPSLMSAGMIDAVLVGCDRVAANGDTANKIGTSYVAIAAKHFGIPFYVCAPSSTIDFACADGKAIVIEQRPAAEVTKMWFNDRMAPEKVKVFNPSFDVTDADLITAIITEYGVASPPYRESLAALIPRNLP